MSYDHKGAMLQDPRFYFSSESQLLLNHETVEPRCTCRLKTEYNPNLNSIAEIDMGFNRGIFYDKQRGSVTSDFAHS